MWPFGVKCPIDAETRLWVDTRMDWLAKEFGIDLWCGARAIEPTDEFFPGRYDCSEHAVRQMLDRVCGYMAVDPQRIALRLYSEKQQPRRGRGIDIRSDEPGTAGTYAPGDQETVSIEISNLDQPTPLVAIMAHELAHARLLGESHISREEEDHERTTDLATVFFGLGIFNANAVFQFRQWSNGRTHGWNSSRLGYLDEQTFGYALALWAFVRGEKRPSWMKHLRLGPRSIMAKSLRFLETARDSRFHVVGRPRP